MTAIDPKHEDQQFEELLLRAERLLASGEASVDECIPGDLDPKLAARLSKAIRGLMLVQQVPVTRAVADVGDQHADQEDRHHGGGDCEHVLPVGFPEQVHEERNHQHGLAAGDGHHEGPSGLLVVGDNAGP